MNYIVITLLVLLAELAGVAATTGVLYVYWNTMKKRHLRSF